MTVSTSVPISRRALLARIGVVAAAGWTLAGCAHGTPAARPGPAGPSSGERDARAAAAAEGVLVTVYEAALVHYPRQRAPLAALLTEHRAHLRALRRAGGLPPAPSGSPLPGGAPSASAGTSASAPAGSPGPSPVALPASPVAGLAHLKALERAAAAQRRVGCLRAGTDGPVAGLLASISASEGSHAALLAALLATVPPAAGS
jgi:hypothetical protein